MLVDNAARLIPNPWEENTGERTRILRDVESARSHVDTP